MRRRLAAAAKMAENAAKSVPAGEGEHFARTRRRVRGALAEHGIAARLGALAAELLDEGRGPASPGPVDADADIDLSDGRDGPIHAGRVFVECST